MKFRTIFVGILFVAFVFAATYGGEGTTRLDHAVHGGGIAGAFLCALLFIISLGEGSG